MDFWKCLICWIVMGLPATVGAQEVRGTEPAETATSTATRVGRSAELAETATSTPPRAKSAKAPASVEPTADDTSPVVRAQPGDYGLIFRFGGLGTLTANGARLFAGDDYNDGLVVHQVGIKKVFTENLMVPFHFGVGFRDDDLDQPKEHIAVIVANVGLEYHFRNWRRISPYFGAALGLSLDASGESDVQPSLSLGPILGIEYYVFDRVSLQAQFSAVVAIGLGEEIQLLVSTQAGGSLNLTFYF